jgi:hypothetical protein
MKKNVVVSIIIFLFLLSGCQATDPKSSEGKDLKDNPVDQTTLNDSNSSETDEVTDNTWFSSDTFEPVNDLIGKGYERSDEYVGRDELIELLQHPIHYSNWEYFSKSNKIIEYKFEDIEYYKKIGDKHIAYYDFTQDFSDNIYYHNFSDGAFSLLIDYQRNTLVFLKNKFKRKEIAGAYKFNEHFDLRDVTFVGGYKDKMEDGHQFVYKGYKAVFLSQNNVLYTVNIDSMEVIQTKDLGNWNFVSAYEKRNFKAKSKDFFIYVINEKDNSLKKILLSKDEVVYERTIDPRIEGEIVKIEHDSPNGIFILSRLPDKYVFYSIREDDFGYIAMKDKDDNGHAFKHIDDFRYYIQNEKSIYLILVRSNSDFPIDKIRAYEGMTELK